MADKIYQIKTDPVGYYPLCRDSSIGRLLLAQCVQPGRLYDFRCIGGPASDRILRAGYTRSCRIYCSRCVHQYAFDSGVPLAETLFGFRPGLPYQYCRCRNRCRGLECAFRTSFSQGQRILSHFNDHGRSIHHRRFHHHAICQPDRRSRAGLFASTRNHQSRPLGD